MNRINLFKGIMVLALISILALPGYIVLYVAPATTAFAKKDSEEMSIRIAAHLAPKIMDLYGDVNNSITQELRETLEGVQKDFETYKVKVYSADGVVVYSTVKKDIGTKNNNKYFYEVIAKGNTHADMVRKGNRTLEGKLIPMNVVETYVPIMVNGQFSGAFEIYFDITKQMENQNRLLSKYYRTSVPIAACMLLAMIAAFITVRKTEMDIKDAQEALQLMQFSMDNSVDPAFWVSKDGSLEYVNKAACEVLGYTKEELCNMKVNDIYHDFPERSWPEQWEYVKKIRTIVFESLYVTKSSRVFPVEITSKYIEYDQKGYRFSFARDITERKKAENDMKELLDSLETRVEDRTAELVEREMQLSSLTHKLISSQEEERTRIARELHDELGQQLTGMQLVIGKLSEEAVPEIKHINMLGDRVEEAMREVRRICKGLRPMALDKLGLASALNALVEDFKERSEIEIVHVSSQEDELDILEDVSITFYRVFQEILNNIIRHSGSGCVSSLFEKKGSVLILKVSDDGKGFDVEEMSTDGRLGIIGLRERAMLCGGTLEIDSGTGRGTCITMQVEI